jgi:hypothetical protein
VVVPGEAPATTTSLQTSSTTQSRTTLGVSALCPLPRDTGTVRAA